MVISGRLIVHAPVLKRGAEIENTWIIFSADHGDGQGDHYHWRKMYPYEFSAHVPMIVRWPANFAAEAGVTIPVLVCAHPNCIRIGTMSVMHGF